MRRVDSASLLSESKTKATKAPQLKAAPIGGKGVGAELMEGAGVPRQAPFQSRLSLERTGGLNIREVKALKMGLEQAFQSTTKSRIQVSARPGTATLFFSFLFFSFLFRSLSLVHTYEYETFTSSSHNSVR